jgi:hypothetical protein
VSVALAEIPLNRLAGLVTEGTGPGTLSLAQHEGNAGIKIYVCQSQAGYFREPHAGVREQADDRCVSSILKFATVHGGQQSGSPGQRGPESCHQRDLDEFSSTAHQ